MPPFPLHRLRPDPAGSGSLWLQIAGTSRWPDWDPRTEKAGLLAPGPTYHPLLLLPGFLEPSLPPHSRATAQAQPGQECFPVFGAQPRSFSSRKPPPPGTEPSNPAPYRLPDSSRSQHWKARAAAFTGCWLTPVSEQVTLHRPTWEVLPCPT